MREALLALAFLTVLGLAGTASAAPSDHHVELEADDGDGCLQETKTDCFRVVNGTSLDGIRQGDVVHVVVRNVGDATHNLHVTDAANASEDHVDTPADAAFAATDGIGAGEQADLTFTVPEDADGLYLWCDVGTHEAGGMWLETDVAEAAPAEDETSEEPDGDEPPSEDTGSEDDSGDNVGRFLPAPGAAAALAATVGAAALVRRRG